MPNPTTIPAIGTPDCNDTGRNGGFYRGAQVPALDSSVAKAQSDQFCY